MCVLQTNYVGNLSYYNINLIQMFDPAVKLVGTHNGYHHIKWSHGSKFKSSTISFCANASANYCLHLQTIVCISFCANASANYW